MLEEDRAELKLLMVEKDIRSVTSHTLHRHKKANNKYMTDYDKNKEWSHSFYCGVNYLYGWTMPQKLSVDSFEWKKDTLRFDVKIS